MALLRLTAAEMIQLSAAWVTPNDEAHQILMSVPPLAALLPQVEAAHQLIISMIPATESPKVKELSAIERTAASVDEAGQSTRLRQSPPPAPRPTGEMSAPHRF